MFLDGRRYVIPRFLPEPFVRTRVADDGKFAPRRDDKEVHGVAIGCPRETTEPERTHGRRMNVSLDVRHD